MGRASDTQHRIMRFVHMRLCKIGRIGRNKRQVASICGLDQSRFSAHFSNVAPAGEFDIEPLRKQSLQPVEQSVGMGFLAISQKTGHCALASSAKRD